MYLNQMIFSFILFGCLAFLIDDDKNKKDNKKSFDKNLAPKVGKADSTTIKITFCIFFIAVIYYFYDQQNNLDT